MHGVSYMAVDLMPCNRNADAYALLDALQYTFHPLLKRDGASSTMPPAAHSKHGR